MSTKPYVTFPIRLPIELHNVLREEAFKNNTSIHRLVLYSIISMIEAGTYKEMLKEDVVAMTSEVSGAEVKPIE